MAKMQGAYDRCIVCAWREPRESLRDVRVLGLGTSRSYPLGTFYVSRIIYAHQFCWDRLMKHFDKPPRLHKLIGVLRLTRVPKYRSLPDYDRPGALQSGIQSMRSKDIKPFLRQTKIMKRNRMPCRKLLSFDSTNQTDCFLFLPIEICLMIAEFLPTSDFLNLRLASKTMAPLFYFEIFWRTRFFLLAERGYLHFLTKTRYHDWATLYRRTCKESKKPVKLNDWRKQWLSNGTVRDKYIMTGEATTPLPRDGEMRLETSDTIQHWERALEPCESECLRVREFVDVLLPLSVRLLVGSRCTKCFRKERSSQFQTVMVSRPILKVAVHVFVQDEDTFVSGLDLIHGPGIPDTVLGYRIPGKQVVVDLCGRDLKGFDLKIRRYIGGIEALRPITQDTADVYHNWVGNYESQRVMLRPFEVVRVPPNHTIVAISGNFQECRLMDLAIGSSEESVDVGEL